MTDDIRATLGLDAKGFDDGLTKATKRVSAFVAAWASIESIKAGYELAKEAALVQDATRVFAASGKDIAALRAETKGMVSDAQLIRQANLAEIMGIPAEAFGKLARIAEASAKKTGQSYDFLLQSIVTGTARQSRLILDNLGLIISVEEANRNYADSLGITSDKLTDAQQKQAFLNEVLRKGTPLIDEIAKSGANASDQFAKFDASIANVKNALGTALIPAASESAKWLEEAARGLQALIEGLSGIGSKQVDIKPGPMLAQLLALPVTLATAGLIDLPGALGVGEAVSFSGTGSEDKIFAQTKKVQELEATLQHLHRTHNKGSPIIEKWTEDLRLARNELVAMKLEADGEARDIGAVQDEFAFTRAGRGRGLTAAPAIIETAEQKNEREKRDKEWRQAQEEKMRVYHRAQSFMTEVLERQARERARLHEEEDRAREESLREFEAKLRGMDETAIRNAIGGGLSEDELALAQDALDAAINEQAEKISIADAERFRDQLEAQQDQNDALIDLERDKWERIDRLEKDALANQARFIEQMITIPLNNLVDDGMTLIEDLIEGEEKALEKFVVNFLGGTGTQIVGLGTKAIVEGTLANLKLPGSGAPLIAGGIGAVGLGIAMGGGGAFASQAFGLGGGGGGDVADRATRRGGAGGVASGEPQSSVNVNFYGGIWGDPVEGGRVVVEALAIARAAGIEGGS